jgi:hypothetical protein
MTEEKRYLITFEWDDKDFYQDSPGVISRLPTPQVVAEKSEIALRATMATIQDIGERVATTMQNMDYPPSGVEVEFGIRLGAESGVLTKDNEHAHFVIKLLWHNGHKKELPEE